MKASSYETLTGPQSQVSAQIKVPFMRPVIGEAEIAEVADSLRSGWLTTGPKTKRFETEFADAVGARNAVALNSATAALHLAVAALGLKPGQAVLVPTMTFAASAEVLNYCGAVPILVDCDPITGNMDLDDANEKIAHYRRGELPFQVKGEIVGIIPVHVGGLMMDIGKIQEFAEKHNLWVVEDAAHAFPAEWREDDSAPWQRCGDNTASITCFSFYANKTITTGEGGMAVTISDRLAEQMRLLSLHGLSRDAWGRYSGGGVWDYRIMEAGFKYNLTDVAASIGIHQLARAEEMRVEREAIAKFYTEQFADLEELATPPSSEDRIHSWHLYPVRLQLERLKCDRNEFVDMLRENDIGFSVHWRPLHLHPFYENRWGWTEKHLPEATKLWKTLVSLPIYPGMTIDEMERVSSVVKMLCSKV